MAAASRSDEVRLTVGIATRNRRALLLRALESVAGQLGPDDELLVVDAGSTDGTREALEAWLAEHSPGGRVLLEDGAGVSRARNALLREARAPFVCCLDDDARAEPDWVDAARRAWSEASERVAVIGGPIEAEWGAPRPEWLRDYFLYVVSILDLGPDRLVLDQTDGVGFVWGANMSVRTTAARKLGGFDERLGSRPDAPAARAEEQELQQRLAAEGYETWYEPSMVVRHYVPAERLTEEYFATQLRERASSEADGVSSLIRAVEALLRSTVRYGLSHLGGGQVDRTVARLQLMYRWNLLRARALPRSQP